MNDDKVFFVALDEFEDLASRLVPLPEVQIVFMAHRGPGKSTLFEEFVKRLSRKGLCAANVAFGERTAYQGFEAIVKPALDIAMAQQAHDALATLRYFPFSADKCRRRTEYREKWVVPVSGNLAWKPAEWQNGTDHTAPLKHGKDAKAVAKRRKKKKLARKS